MKAAAIPYEPGFWVGWYVHCRRARCGFHRLLMMPSDLTQLRERAR